MSELQYTLALYDNILPSITSSKSEQEAACSDSEIPTVLSESCVRIMSSDHMLLCFPWQTQGSPPLHWGD